jgi:hypothetical protein
MTTRHNNGGQDVKIQSPNECQNPKPKTNNHEKGKEGKHEIVGFLGAEH